MYFVCYVFKRMLNCSGSEQDSKGGCSEILGLPPSLKMQLNAAMVIGRGKPLREALCSHCSRSSKGYLPERPHCHEDTVAWENPKFSMRLLYTVRR